MEEIFNLMYKPGPHGIRYRYFMYSTNNLTCTDFNKNITLYKKKKKKKKKKKIPI